MSQDNETRLGMGLAWMMQTVHQSHHEGPLRECPKSTCAFARNLLAQLDGKDADVEPNPWERLRHETYDRMVTRLKLGKEPTLTINGFTTPEQWPFFAAVTVCRPGNYHALNVFVQFVDQLNLLASTRRLAVNNELVGAK